MLANTDYSSQYLGIIITDDMKWNKHVAYATKKAGSKLGMLRRQLNNTSSKTRLTLYKTIIQPKLEYSSSVWSPHLAKDQADLERIQRQSIRRIKQLGKKESVTQAMVTIDIDAWKQKILIKDAKLFEEMRTKNIDTDLEKYTLKTTMNTRKKLTQQQAQTTQFYNFYFVRAIRNSIGWSE